MRWLADLILVFHFVYVLFVVGGLLAIWTGGALGWRWVRNLWFRLIHLAAILLVAVQSLLGTWCPLTIWENRLRGTETQGGFLQHWIHRLMFFEAPMWVFTVAYAAFAVVVVATFFVVRPERRGRTDSTRPVSP